MMPTYADVYPGLWKGSWGQAPEVFGLSFDDAEAQVCELCLWHNCDRCRFHEGTWAEQGPPPLGLVLNGRDYYERLPARDGRRDADAEIDDTVQRSGAALIFHHGPSQSIVFPQSMRWLTFKEAEHEVEEHRAFKGAKEEATMADQGKTLVVHCDGGKRGDGSTYGSVRIGRKVWRREFGPEGSNHVAEYKALVNALYLARVVVENNGDVVAVEIRMDSKLVVNQVLGAWRCKAEHLQPLRDRALQERDALLAAMRCHPAAQPRGGLAERGTCAPFCTGGGVDVAAVRLVEITEAQMKGVIGH
jgi:ribonuclease HI